MDKKDDREEDRSIGKGAIVAMLTIVLALTLVSLYANWLNAHRSRIESTTITRFSPSPTPAPSATP
jgi:hypothetical protein